MRGHTHPVHLEDHEKCVKTLEMNKKILGSIVVGCGTYLNAHKDENAFLSVITTQISKKVTFVVGGVVVQIKI